MLLLLRLNTLAPVAKITIRATMIPIKTPEEIQAMREGGKILAQILHELAAAAKINVRTEELNLKAEALMAKYNVLPSFKGYRGFPAVICASINEEVVHGIPGKRELNDGDIIKIDCGIMHKGLHTDASVAVLIGNVKPETQTFVHTIQKALEKGIAAARPGAHIGDIGFAIQQTVEIHGYSPVREYIGHGVGRSLHEDPEIPNWGSKGKGPMLVPGMTLAIEPIAMGKRFIDLKPDKWTAVTRDKMPACQIEHTIVILASGCEVLTKCDNNINCVFAH